MKKGIMALEGLEEVISNPEVEAPSVDEVPVDAAKGDELIDVNQGNDIDDLLENINDNSNVVTTLESIANILSQSKDGLTPNNAKPLNTAIEHLLRSIDQNPKVLPAMEAFGGTKTKLQATMESIEKIKEVAKDLWEKIKAWFQKLWNAIKNFYSEMTKADNINQQKSDSLKDKIDECEKEVKEAVKVKKEEIKEIQKNEPEQYKEIIKETEIVSKDNKEFKAKVLSLGYTKALELSKTHETESVRIPEHLLNIIGYPRGTDLMTSTFYIDFSDIFKRNGSLDNFLRNTLRIYRAYVSKLNSSEVEELAKEDRNEMIKNMAYGFKSTLPEFNIPFGNIEKIEIKLLNDNFYTDNSNNTMHAPIVSFIRRQKINELTGYPEGISYAKEHILKNISENKISQKLILFKELSDNCYNESVAIERTYQKQIFITKDESKVENILWVYRQTLNLYRIISNFIQVITKWVNAVYSAALHFVNLTVNNTKSRYGHLMKSHGYIKDIEELAGTWF